MDKATQDEGNGRFYQMKRDNAAIVAAFNQQYGGPEHLEHGAKSETTGVSRPAWKDRLRNVIEDSVRATKNLPASVGHRGHLAPEGVYFTLRYFSVHSPHGVRGILPGTKVVRVRDVGPSMLRVSAGDIQFDAKAQDLTNDLDVADLASRNDEQAQEDVASSIAHDQAMDKARREEENTAFEQRQREIEAERAAEAKAARYENPLERGPYGTPNP